MEFAKNMYELHKKVSPNELILGWWVGMGVERLSGWLPAPFATWLGSVLPLLETEYWMCIISRSWEFCVFCWQFWSCKAKNTHFELQLLLSKSFLPCWWLRVFHEVLSQPCFIWFNKIISVLFFFFLQCCPWGYNYHKGVRYPETPMPPSCLVLMSHVDMSPQLFHFPGTLQAMTSRSTQCWSMSTTAEKPPTPFTSQWTPASKTAAWASRPMSGDQGLGPQGYEASFIRANPRWHPPPPHAGVILQFATCCLLRKPLPHSRQLSLERFYSERNCPWSYHLLTLACPDFCSLLIASFQGQRFRYLSKLVFPVIFSRS